MRVLNNVPDIPTVLPDVPGVGSAFPGVMGPAIQDAMRQAKEVMAALAQEGAGKQVYTFEWDLSPQSGAPPVN